MTVTARIIQARLGGELIGDDGKPLSGVSSLPNARAGEITYADDSKFHAQVCSTEAGLIVVREDFPPVDGVTLLKVARPKVFFSLIMQMFVEHDGPDDGVHESAVVHPGASIAKDVAIGEHVVVRDQVEIGSGCRIEAGSFIGKGVTLGDDCRIGPNVTLQARCSIGSRVVIHAGTVVGADGFGYVWDGEKHARIPQLGSVVIEDDVEIGSNVSIDRATFSVTRIGRGVRLDNLVHIAHNVDLGEHVVMAALCGVAGSATLKKGVMVGGCAAISDHITVGEGAMIGGASVVVKDVEGGQVVWGIPAHDMRQVKKEQICLSRLPDMMKDIRRLLKQ